MAKESEKIQDLEGEVWKDIQGYEGLYQISNMGRVKSLSRTVSTSNNRTKHYPEKIRITLSKNHGHLMVNLPLKSNKTYRTYLVSRLVAMAFVANPENHRFVEHVDGNSMNNASHNIRWVYQYTQDTHRTNEVKLFSGPIDNEEWKDIKGHEGFYMISSHGRVKSILENIIRKPSMHYKVGYYKLDIRKPFRKTYMVHRLVAEHFVPNPYGKKTVNHIDGNKLNNCASNLEWLTFRENTTHYAVSNSRKLNGKSSKYIGVHSPNHSNKWISKISFEGKKLYLGAYPTEQEAYEARRKFEQDNGI